MGRHHSVFCTLTKGICVLHGKTVRFINSPWFNDSTCHIYLIKKQTWSRHVMLQKVQLLDSARVSEYHKNCLRRRRHQNFRHLWFSKSDSGAVPGTIACMTKNTTFQTGQKKNTPSQLEMMMWMTYGPTTHGGWPMVLTKGAKKPDFPKKPWPKKMS